LDLMIGADSGADARRTAPVAGDARLVVARVKEKTVAMLYRPVAPEAKGRSPRTEGACAWALNASGRAWATF